MQLTVSCRSAAPLCPPWLYFCLHPLVEDTDRESVASVGRKEKNQGGPLKPRGYYVKPRGSFSLRLPYRRGQKRARGVAVQGDASM